MKEKKGHLTAAPNDPAYFADLSAHAQRNRLISALRVGPVTTIEARRELDILMPAARVHELRHRYGFDIQMTRIRQSTECGTFHSVAQYVLVSGGGHDA